MKHLFKIAFALILSLSFFACSEDNTENINNDTNNSFEKSIAILDTNSKVEGKTSKSNLEALTIELINFNEDYSLNEAYKINDIEFNDNGLFNDAIAGDGIYTSVELFDPLENKSKEAGDKLSYSENFAFTEDLKKELRSRYEGKRDVGISVSCDIVTRPCPQTTWYNTCYFSDECTCVYLENCTGTVSIEF